MLFRQALTEQSWDSWKRISSRPAAAGGAGSGGNAARSWKASGRLQRVARGEAVPGVLEEVTVFCFFIPSLCT